MAHSLDPYTAEIAHVLIFDIVGYSKQTFEAQARLVAELTRLVRATPEFQRADKEGELLTRSTGDGMALVFFRYPLSAVQCAVEIARACVHHADLRLRMGLHTGPVSRATDITGAPNVTGGGINTAQRVMDCGDAGHILLSSTLAEVLRQFESWRDSLHDLGEYTVKHDEQIRLFNLCLEQIGNPAIPERMKDEGGRMKAETRRRKLDSANTQSAPEAFSHPSSLIPHPSQTVALLYKRNAPHSAYLLEVLEKGLKAAGYGVFIDRHLKVGVEWAQELKRQVCAAFAVVPLLSAESIWSEMVEDEVQTAHDAGLEQGGQPRLLPVRVAYEDPLPEPLHNLLGGLQYTLWRGPEDDERLLAELLDALHGEPKPAAPIADLEPVGGAVPLDSKFYIVRDTDTEFATALARRDSIVLVKGARQMGKTSLLTRGLQQAREKGLRCFRTDFQKLTATNLQSEETFFRSLAEMIADQLDLDTLPGDNGKAHRNGASNFERYLRREVLQPSAVPVVWALDEVDKLFACPFGSDVFALFRSWHNDRSYEPDGPWGKLTMAIAYATEAHLFITDVNQSPFNVGTRVTLDDFTLEQVIELNRRYGSPLRDAGEVGRFHALVGGQPYLTRRGLDQMVQHDLALAALEAQADRDDGIFGDHLRRLLVMLTQDEETLETVQRLLCGTPLPNAAIFYRLRSGGLLSGTSERDCRLRCQLYGSYLHHHLNRE